MFAAWKLSTKLGVAFAALVAFAAALGALAII